MKTLNEIDREEIVNDCLVPAFTCMNPEFAACVLEGMLKDYMNTSAWDMKNSGIRSNRVFVIGNLVGLLNDLSEYFPHE